MKDQDVIGKKIIYADEQAILNLNYTITNSVSTKSKAQYQLLLNAHIHQKDLDIQQLHFKLKQNGFLIHQNQQFDLQQKIKTIQIKVFPKCKNWEVVQLYCKLGRYQKHFQILNCNQSQVHQMNVFSFGSVGSIYKYSNNQHICAVKCLKTINSLLQNEQLIFMDITQYFIMSMMSALQIGPKIAPFMGFDFVISKNCIQYSMQLCTSFKNKQVSLQIEQNLKRYLKKMHLLNIVHLDIKPSNIMFSNEFSKIVFIDFGLSQFIDSEAGIKILTTFKGTAGFCSKQMLQCLNGPQQIDIYLNDAKCLINIFNALKLQKNRKQQSFNTVKKFNQDIILEEKNYSEIQKTININLIKFLLINEAFAQAASFIQKHVNKQITEEGKYYIQNQIFQFLINLQLSSNFWAIFHQNFNRFSLIYSKLLNYFQSFRNFGQQQANLNKQSLNVHTFQKIYGNLELCNTYFYCFVFKDKVKQILLSQALQVQKFTYLNLFIKFTSFSSNIFRINLDQKYKASIVFLNCHKNKFMNDIQVQNQLKLVQQNMPVEQSLSEQLKQISKCIVLCMAIVSQSKIDISKISHFIRLQLSKQLSIFFFVNCQKLKKNYQKIKNCWIFLSTLRSYFTLKLKLRKDYKQNALLKFASQNVIIQNIRNQFENLNKQLQNNYLQHQNDCYKQILKICLNFTGFIYPTFHKCKIKGLIDQICQLYDRHKLSFKNQNSQIFMEIIRLMILSIKNQLQQTSDIQMFLREQLFLSYKSFLIKATRNTVFFDLVNIKFYFRRLSYSKGKQLLLKFDNQINCSQISDSFFTCERLKQALINNNLQQIRKYFSLISRQQIINICNFSQIRFLFQFFNQILYIFPLNIGPSAIVFEEKDKMFIKNWMKQAINKLTQNHLVSKSDQYDKDMCSILLNLNRKAFCILQYEDVQINIIKQRLTIINSQIINQNYFNNKFILSQCFYTYYQNVGNQVQQVNSVLQFVKDLQKQLKKNKIKGIIRPIWIIEIVKFIKVYIS